MPIIKARVIEVALMRDVAHADRERKRFHSYEEALMHVDDAQLTPDVDTISIYPVDITMDVSDDIFVSKEDVDG